MKTITMTIEQYNQIRALKKFAQWFVDEHENASGSDEMIDQWESDRDEVRAGTEAIYAVDLMIDRERTAKREEIATLNLWNS